jgi:hypothetical protein
VSSDHLEAEQAANKSAGASGDATLRSTSARSHVPLTTAPPWARAHRHGPGEERAEAAESGKVVPEKSPSSATSSATRSPLAGDEGTAVAGHPGARVHTGPDDRAFATLLGARAATHGRDIFLAEGESVSDEALMRHELTHVAEGGEAVRLRSATYLERRTWLAFFDHYLPRKFLNNYMDDTGAAITLTLREMRDCNPIVDLRRSTAFMGRVSSLVAAGGGTASISVRGWGGALTNGSLGNFTINYTGTLVVQPDGKWSFSGTMTFYDYWDFDPKGAGSGRSVAGEVKVRVASAFLPGRPFDIHSVAAAVSQSSTDPRAVWGGGGAPVHVPDKSARTGADIATGDVAGGAAGGAAAGPVGDIAGGDVGADTGAQASEDLNR